MIFNEKSLLSDYVTLWNSLRGVVRAITLMGLVQY